MPLIQLDVQPLDDDQRAELRERAVMAVCENLGVPDQYVSIVIREVEARNLVETGAWGDYEDRQRIEYTRSPA
jgi:phenylpyruvate tautomerase PptA (4-oxalocrotonate tautomerase family)